MGFYVNPKNMTKEKFLESVGQELTTQEFLESTFEETKELGANMVVLIDNGAFKAALICYNESEHKELQDNPDPRPKKYFIVGVEHLQQFMN